MMMNQAKARRWGWLLALISPLGLAALPRAAADNPRVSLKLRQVTCREAVAALSQAANQPVELLAQEPPDPLLAERADFDWSDTTLAHALRALCERYRLRAQVGFRDGRHRLMFTGLAQPQGPVAHVVARNGIRVYVRSLTLQESRNRSLDFVHGGAEVGGGSGLQLSLVCRLNARDPDTVTGVENLVARDDQGHQLVEEHHLAFTAGLEREFPDEWQERFFLPLPAAGAKQLTEVSGELWGYRFRREERVELLLAGNELPPAKELKGLRFEVTAVESGPARVAGAGGEPRLRTRVTVPAALAVGVPLGIRSLGAAAQRRGAPDLPFTEAPVLLGASGKRFKPVAGSITAREAGEVVHFDTQANYGQVDEPVVAARFARIETGPREKLLSFRLVNIPLPAAEFQAAPPGGVPAGPRPYLDRNGGTLVSRVTRQGRPAPGGTLTLGLARQGPAGWDPLHWLHLPVGTDGSVRLAELAPGTYRVLRAYRPPGDPDAGPPGRWQNGMVELEVAPGKSAAAPPLAWTRDGAHGQPAAKPAPRRPAAPGRAGRGR